MTTDRTSRCNCELIGTKKKGGQIFKILERARRERDAPFDRDTQWFWSRTTKRGGKRKLRKTTRNAGKKKSSARRNDAVTREQFQLEIVPCHARRILVYIKTNCCSLRWRERTEIDAMDVHPVWPPPPFASPLLRPPSTAARDFATGIDVLWERDAPKSKRLHRNNVISKHFRVFTDLHNCYNRQQTIIFYQFIITFPLAPAVDEIPVNEIVYPSDNCCTDDANEIISLSRFVESLLQFFGIYFSPDCQPSVLVV